MGRPCVNHEVCAGTVAPWASLLLCSSGWCGNCRASIGKTAIQPVHSYSDECCPVCQRHGNPLFLFPKCPRCHVACADCLSRALFFDERSFRISSAAFGGPRCPNWCRNPTLGRQCSCRDHADALLAWRRDEPFAYHQWRRANEASVTNWRFIEQESGNAQGNCPTCARGAC